MHATKRECSNHDAILGPYEHKAQLSSSLRSVIDDPGLQIYWGSQNLDSALKYKKGKSPEQLSGERVGEFY